jgi:hypothetical protein
MGRNPLSLWHFRPVRRAGSGVHAPQHFLYFLPLPQGHGSFLPIFDVALLIWEGNAPRLSLDSADLANFGRYRAQTMGDRVIGQSEQPQNE